MLLLIDNYDSFTYNLKDYFEQLKQEVIVVRNDEIDAQSIQNLSFDKIVLSPGPKRPLQAGNLMEIIAQTYLHFPILGICLGHQALGEFFGGKLVLAQKPMHGKVSEIQCQATGIYQDLPKTFNVCRYHSLIIQNLENTPLKTTATTNNHECMSFDHQDLPITGIQYHPEAILTENGLKILANWLNSIQNG
ncbi:MAG: aminodeoxychorismate/anthranilate synthase component II [Bacteroidota bacterium]|nr:aminodeoxychorismate/anthranilate synthase component II [Bacteroidota bacterium]